MVEKYLSWILEFLNGALTSLVAPFARFTGLGIGTKGRRFPLKVGELEINQNGKVVQLRISVGAIRFYSRGLA